MQSTTATGKTLIQRAEDEMREIGCDVLIAPGFGVVPDTPDTISPCALTPLTLESCGGCPISRVPHGNPAHLDGMERAFQAAEPHL